MSDHYDRYNGMENLLGTNLASLGADCISRQSAIEVIERARAHIGHNMERAVGRVFLEMLDDVGLSISKLPPIQPEPHWIPVTERLPETELQHPGHGISDYLKSDMVAVSGDFDYGDKVWIACYCDDLDGKTYWSDMDANTLYNVIAWMPLPEPYKGVNT